MSDTYYPYEWMLEQTPDPATHPTDYYEHTHYWEEDLSKDHPDYAGAPTIWRHFTLLLKRKTKTLTFLSWQPEGLSWETPYANRYSSYTNLRYNHPKMAADVARMARSMINPNYSASEDKGIHAFNYEGTTFVLTLRPQIQHWRVCGWAHPHIADDDYELWRPNE